MKKVKFQFISPFMFLALIVLSIGCNDKDDPAPAKASFDVSTEEADTDVPISFTNTSENSKYYFWDFGDGSRSTDENPTHAYDSVGIYDVRLVVIGNSSSDTAFSQLTIGGGNVTLFEGYGITGVTLFETTWSELETTYGTDTTSILRYSESQDYYYYVIVYKDKGVSFYLYSKGAAKLYPTAYVYGISVWSDKYQGGTTTKGVGIRSTLATMERAYGKAEEEIDGVFNDHEFTLYSYPSLGIDFLDFNEDMIYEVEIYQAAITTKSTNSQLPDIKEDFKNYNSKRSVKL